MKKLLLTLSLLIPGYLHADSVTPGSVGLLIPSTGVIDTSRRWDDKYKGNFRIIASTLSGILNGSLSVPGATGGTVVNSTPIVGYNDTTPLVGGGISTLKITGSGGSASQSGSTMTITVTGGGATTSVSTITIPMAGGGVFLSTFQPIGSTVQRITKGTFTVAGVDVFAVTQSTVAATMFKVWRATDTNFSNCWSTVTPQIVLGTQATGGYQPNTYNTYISTAYKLFDGFFYGIGIDTVPTSGILTQDWVVNLHGFFDRSNITW